MTFYNGGSIGRASSNDWILHDKSRYISSKHASIESVNGLYQITDISTNGVYLNDSATPIGKGGIAILNDGDRLQIGEMEIAVQVNSDEFDSISPGQNAFLNNAPGGDPLANNFSNNALNSGNMGNVNSDSQPVDPLAFFQSGQPVVKSSPGNPVPGGNHSGSNNLSMDSLVDDKKPGSLDPLAGFDSPAASNRDGNFGFFDNQPNQNNAQGGTSGIDHGSPMNVHFQPPDNETPIIPDDFTFSGGENNAQSGQQPGNYIPEDVMNFMNSGNSGANSGNNINNGSNAGNKSQNNIGQAMEAIAEKVAKPKVSPYDNVTAARTSQKPAANPSVVSAQNSVSNVTPSKSNSDEVLQAFFKGLGLANTNVTARDTAAFMESVGRILRETINGTMSILRARSNIKSGFRVSMTTIRAAENNPLKFSISVDDAIKNMFSTKSNSYLRPLAALQEGFEDIENHQLAVMAGMQAALKAIIENFDPETLEFKFNKQNGGKLLTGNKKAKCWDAYKVRYNEVSQSIDDQFQNMFGDAFARAYEEQIAKLNLSKK